MTAAQWKDIAGYCGVYQVSSNGDIRRAKRLRKNADVGPRHPFKDKDGYLRIQLCRNGSKRKHYVHRLVLEAFVGDQPEGMECRHLNGDPSDNRLENLEWATHRSNLEDQARHGTRSIGERHGMAVITELDVRSIRLECGKSGEVAEKLGISIHAVYGVRQGRTWRHVR